MDNSVRFGLSNPALHNDIGMTLIERQFPVVIDEVTGEPDLGMQNVRLNNGQPEQDILDKERKNKKSSSLLKKLLIGLGIAGAGVLLFKKGKPMLNAVKNTFNKIISKFKP